MYPSVYKITTARVRLISSVHYYHLIKCNLFWPWYNWSIAHLTLDNNHSLHRSSFTVVISCHHFHLIYDTYQKSGEKTSVIINLCITTGAISGTGTAYLYEHLVSSPVFDGVGVARIQFYVLLVTMCFSFFTDIIRFLYHVFLSSVYRSLQEVGQSI